MPDLFSPDIQLDVYGGDTAVVGTNARTGGAGGDAPAALSVAAALQLVKGSLESLRLNIVGEVADFSGARYPQKYFKLKDADTDAVIDCIMWKDAYAAAVAAGAVLENGMLIEASGRFSVYPKTGKMQFQVYRVTCSGEGALRMALARLEAKLRAEGLFDPERKQTLPEWPAKIAVVTSGAGSAIHDVCRTLARRWPVAELLFFGTRVEGEGAAAQIVRALEQADAAAADVLLLVRGGGSFNDLLVFSDEAVVRAGAACVTPLVTGIGHEPDNNLVDYVADLRAPTPTGAATAATPDITALRERVTGMRASLANGLDRTLQLARMRLERVAQRAVMRRPAQMLSPFMQAVDVAHERLRRSIPARLERDSARVHAARHRMVVLAPRLTQRPQASAVALTGRLEALSPLKVLSRGYSVVFADDGHTVLDSIERVQTGDDIRIRLSDGHIQAQVKGKGSL
ncbi:MAG: exodeoxyribonuclease VII large subunit [Actinomycetes bacterium]|nr:exodeoxyribonuclease VII large subunit [Actinomycetes bacterium]